MTKYIVKDTEEAFLLRQIFRACGINESVVKAAAIKPIISICQAVILANNIDDFTRNHDYFFGSFALKVFLGQFVFEN